MSFHPWKGISKVLFSFHIDIIVVQLLDQRCSEIFSKYGRRVEVKIQTNILKIILAGYDLCHHLFQTMNIKNRYRYRSF